MAKLFEAKDYSIHKADNKILLVKEYKGSEEQNLNSSYLSRC